MKGNGRGYVAFRVTPQDCGTDFRVGDTVEQPTSGVGTVASFVVETGGRGLSST